MRAGRVPDHQYLITALRQRLGNFGGKLGHARLELGRIGAKVARRIGVIMHQVISKEPAIHAAEPFQHHRHRQKPAPGRQRMPEGQNVAEPPGQQQSQPQLSDEKADRVKRRDHRPLAQPHQPEQGARADITRRRADQLQIGGDDPVIHAGFDDIGPDQHRDLALHLCAVDLCRHAPAKARALCARAKRDFIARHPRLRGAFLAVKLAVAARRNGIISRNVKHPPAADFGGLGAAHTLPLARASLAQDFAKGKDLSKHRKRREGFEQPE